MPPNNNALPFKYLTALLLTFGLLGFWACQGPVAIDQPIPTPTVQQHLQPVSQLPGARLGLQSLQKMYPATGPAYARFGSGYMPTPWGLLDTTYVLALQRPGGRPYYTFVLQPEQPYGNGAFKRLLLYPTPQGHKAMLFTYTPNNHWRPGQPFAGQVQVNDLEGAGLGQFLAQGAQWQPAIPQAGTGQRVQTTQSFETCITDVVTYYEGQDCNAVSNTTGLPLPEELQGNCHLVVELVYGLCNNLAGGAGPTLGGDPTSAPGTNLPPTGGSSPGTSPPAIDPEEGVLTSDLAILDLSLLMELVAWGEDHINDSLVAKCVQDVLDDIMSSQNSVGKSLYFLMAGFLSEKEPAYNWNIIQGSLPPTKNAQTSNYNTTTQSVTTTIDINKYRNATDLAIAATLYHECMHAYFAAKLKLNPVLSQFELKDLLLAYDTISDTNDAHHVVIVNNYRLEIEKVIRNYAITKNYNLSDSTYIALSWKGLTDTKAFEELNQGIQKSIKSMILTEQQGTDLYGRPATPTGTKMNCK